MTVRIATLATGALISAGASCVAGARFRQRTKRQAEAAIAQADGILRANEDHVRQRRERQG